MSAKSASAVASAAKTASEDKEAVICGFCSNEITVKQNKNHQKACHLCQNSYYLHPKCAVKVWLLSSQTKSKMKTIATLKFNNSSVLLHCYECRQDHCFYCGIDHSSKLSII